MLEDKNQPIEEANPEELEDFFEEAEEPQFDVTVDEIDPNKTILVNCKPVYNFQSVEFSMEISPNNPDHLAALESIYNSMLQILIRVSVDQPNQGNKKPSEPLATDKQKDLMDKCNIKYKADCTVKEAQALIDKYFGK